jgi:hypothetical protein
MTTRGSSVTQVRVSTEDKKASLVLKLKDKPNKPSIKWSEDTINNENMGRKSSKRKNDEISRFLILRSPIRILT